MSAFGGKTDIGRTSQPNILKISAHDPSATFGGQIVLQRTNMAFIGVP
jgi:hypothetical protein